MTLPVSVIIPHKRSRHSFLVEKCLPSVFENKPAEVIVLGEEDSANVKRNRGSVMATQIFLFFCDDDVVLLKDCLEAMVGALEVHEDAAFAYSGFQHVIHSGVAFPAPAGAYMPVPWDVERLRYRNYVNMMSLIRREYFPGFDPGIRRYEDWDLWLTIVERGGKGTWVNDILFQSHHIDRGITMTESDDWLERVKRRHGIL